MLNPLIHLLITENAAKDLSVPFQEEESQERLAVASKVDIMLPVISYFDIVIQFTKP